MPPSHRWQCEIVKHSGSRISAVPSCISSFGAGEIEIVKVGTITLIPIHSLQCFLEVRMNGR